MSGKAMKTIPSYLIQSRDTVHAAIDDPRFCEAVQGIAEVIAVALGRGVSSF